MSLLNCCDCQMMLWTSFGNENEDIFDQVIHFEKTNEMDSLYDFQFFLRILHTYLAVS